MSPDPRLPTYSYGGTFDIGGTLYTYDGGVRPINLGAGWVPGLEGAWAYGGGDGFNFGDWYNLATESSSLATLAHARYDLTDNIRFVTDLQYSQSSGISRGEPHATVAGVAIGLDNPFLPNDVRALMADPDRNPATNDAVTSISVTRDDADQGRIIVDATRTTYTGVARLEGDLGPSLHWRAFAQFGRYDANNLTKNMRITVPYFQSVDAVADPVTGQPVCRINVDSDPGNDNSACRPVNIFGPNAAATTPDALAYFDRNILTTTINEQTVFGAQMSGDLLTLPGGPLAFVAGAEYRRESLTADADGLATTGQLDFYSFRPQHGAVSVKEVFGEMSAPLLKDVPFAHYLEANGAIRYSSYNTGIKATTWNLGAVYAPIPDLRFRASRSRAVRAPNIIELFSAGISGLITVSDPCDASQIDASANRLANCRALGIPDGFSDNGLGSRQGFTSGNVNLAPETADSLTLGVVLQPRILPGLNLSVDFWDIRIKGVISQPGTGEIINGCVDGPVLNNTFCGFVTRDADHRIIRVENLFANFSSMTERGIDFGLDYSRDVGTLGGNPLRLGASFDGTYIIRETFSPDPAHPENIQRGDGTQDFPRFRGNLTTTATAGKYSLAWTARYISSIVNNPTINKDADVNNAFAARLYHDLYFTAAVTERFNIGVGVNNLFDVIPPGVDPVRGGYYDVYGRSFFMTANLKL